MSEMRQSDALKMLMKESNIEEEERDRILEEFNSTNENLKGKIVAQKDRQVRFEKSHFSGFLFDQLIKFLKIFVKKKYEKLDKF